MPLRSGVNLHSQMREQEAQVVGEVTTRQRFSEGYNCLLRDDLGGGIPGPHPDSSWWEPHLGCRATDLKLELA